MISRFTKQLVFVMFTLVLLATIAMFHTPSRAYIDPWTGQFFGEGGVEKSYIAPPSNKEKPSPPSLGGHVMGDVIMPKLANATAKAALGRATWKLLHTITLRYPEHPTQDQRDALDAYFHLSSRLYPCGECAHEFQQLLRGYPPQTSSRRAAALWLCSLHNMVNKRLEKPEFDCANLDSEYDCGCGDDPVNVKKPNASSVEGGEDELTGAQLIKGGRVSYHGGIEFIDFMTFSPDGK